MIFLNLIKVANVLTGDISIVRFGSNKQTNTEKFMDSYGTVNYDESQSIS